MEGVVGPPGAPAGLGTLMMPSWEAQVQTEHPAKDEGDEPHA